MPSDNQLLFEALNAYGMVKARKVEPLRHNEGLTFLVNNFDYKYLLKIRKPLTGFNTSIVKGDFNDVDLVSEEMVYLRYLSDHTQYIYQNPIANPKGEYQSVLSNGVTATLQVYLNGSTLASIENKTPYMEKLGKMIAQIHHANYCSDKRFSYDDKLVARLKVEIEKGYQNNCFEKDVYKTLQEVGNLIIKRIANLPLQMVHADLNANNILVNEGSISLIDFSLCGMASPYFDIASVLCSFLNRAQQQAFIKGYEEESKTKVEEQNIEPYYALSVYLFIACQYQLYWKEGWFKEALIRWNTNIFIPFLEGKSFVYE